VRWDHLFKHCAFKVLVCLLLLLGGCRSLDILTECISFSSFLPETLIIFGAATDSLVKACNMTGKRGERR
jgi:hypothetical protein